MAVVEHRIVQSINITPGAVVTYRSELEKRLLALKTAINTELANRGLAIMELGYDPDKNIYHYCVPASYNEEDYPIIKGVVERYCGYYNPSDPFLALDTALVVIASGHTLEEAKLRAHAFGCSTPIMEQKKS